MKEIAADALVNTMAHYIVGDTDAEFNLEQAARMVTLTMRAYKALRIGLSDLTGE